MKKLLLIGFIALCLTLTSSAQTTYKSVIGLEDINWGNSTFTRQTPSGGLITLNQVGGFKDVRSYTSINHAIASIASTQTTLVISTAQTLTANLTIPSTLSLVILKGGSIVKASTYTLTINGPFEAGLYQVFSGFTTGISFGQGAVAEVYPEWWAVNTTPGTTDMAVAVQSALSSLPSNGGTVLINGIHAIGSASWIGINLSSKNNITIKASDKGGTFKLLAAPTQYLPQGAFSKTWFKFTSCSKVKISGLTFDTNSIDANVIGMVSTTDSEISHNYLDGTTGADLAFVMTEGCLRNWYYKNTIIGAYHAFILGRAGNAGTEEQYSSVERNVIKDTGNAAINYCGLYGDITYNKIINCGMDGISANPSGLVASPTTQSEGLQIIGNEIITAAGEGITLEAVSTDTAPNVALLIADNYIKSANEGIRLYQVIDTIVRGNRVINSIGPGIVLTPRTPATASGDSKRVTISNNIIYDTRAGAARTQTYGIYATTGTAIATTISDLIIIGNITSNNTVNGIQAVVQSDPLGTGTRLNINGNNSSDNVEWGIIVNGPWTYASLTGNVCIGNDTGAPGTKGDIGISASVVTKNAWLFGNIVTSWSKLYLGNPQFVDGILNTGAPTTGWIPKWNAGNYAEWATP